MNEQPLEGEIVRQPTSVMLTKYDEEIVRMLETAFNNLYNITEACEYAGISRDTYYRWLEEDDIFSNRMSIARSAPNRKAKANVVAAIEQGDPKISLSLLKLRDPEFKPKGELEVNPGLTETRNKIKDFLDDTNNNEHDGSSQLAAGNQS